MMSLMTNLLAASHQGFFYPMQASTFAKEVDPLAWFIHGVTIFFTVLIIGLTVYFVVKYRASVHPIPQPPGHNNVLEVAWTAIPAVVVFICFFWGFRVYMRMNTQQPAAETVQAVGQTWFWQFKYRSPLTGNEMTVPEMYLPLNVPTRVQLQSIDVIHSLFLPALRMKKDVVPGRFNEMYVEATVAGDYDVYCAEYCGDSHSTMASRLHVLPYDQYTAKLAELSRWDRDVGRLPDSDVGLQLVTNNGCFSCHSKDGAPGTGPTWLNMFGDTNHEMADGSVITVNEEYVHESIRNPNAKVRKGFGPPSAMNPFTPTQIPDAQIPYIVAYMKSISDKAPKSAPTTQSTTQNASEHTGVPRIPDQQETVPAGRGTPASK